MPFPAAWKSLQDVGASGRQGSDIASRSNAKIHRSIRSGQSVRWTTCHPILLKIRRHHVSSLPEEIASAPSMQPSHCCHLRQRPLSPCKIAEAISFRKAPYSVSFFPSAIQPGTKPYRKGLEAGEKTVYSQSVLSTAQRFGLSRYATIRAMEST